VGRRRRRGVQRIYLAKAHREDRKPPRDFELD
jgi:hypothetical protein